jgi:hypothetical protein
MKLNIETLKAKLATLVFDFSTLFLPSLVAGSEGIARPKEGPTVAVVVAPADTTITRPASWGQGQDLEITTGSHHIAQDANGDSYPNLEYKDFYVTGVILDPATDERAAFLQAFWAERGFPNVEIREGAKTKEALVVGQVTAESNGKIFANHEGTTVLSEDGYILESPLDPLVRWFITKKVYDKKYQPVAKA